MQCDVMDINFERELFRKFSYRVMFAREKDEAWKFSLNDVQQDATS
jgi:hypothetical protein